ncbi:uncharacterized protein EAF02_002791 [Botrytis sinoallii]|uniref:uncharacterized protein n=1 Tax=Botrytis sinoallii TaxID=1463999 RepID=UPI001902A948|nr:uncharacterized protein EAF02_002791 [Botrytis sinoallii]KAF7888250.1 hypothetical protein EAF02_002791 [Botrytis sinoallii]
MPPEIHTCTLHYTQTLHQNLSQPSIRKPWSIYLQTRTHWHTIEFHEQAILQSRLSSHSHSRAKYSSRDVYDFQLRELGAPPKIWKRCPDSDTAEAEVSKLVKEFGGGERKYWDEEIVAGIWGESEEGGNPVSQIQPGSSQESWIWNETRTFLKLTHHSGPNKSGLYLIPNPYPSSSSSSSSPQDPILFSWTHGSLTTKDNTLYARGKCLTFSPPPQHSSPPPPPVHFHPLPKGSLTPSPHFAASINRSHFSKHWEEYEVDINQPAIPCIWWEKNITILEDGVLLREYEDLYERSKEKGGPQFTPSTFLAQIFHTINTSIPPSKKRGGKTNPPNDDNHSIDISELYERGRQDLERSKQDLARSKRRKYCLRELALSTSSSSSSFSSSSQPPRSQSLPARTRTRTRTKTRIPQDSIPPSTHREEATTKPKMLNSAPDRNHAVLPKRDPPPNLHVN